MAVNRVRPASKTSRNASCPPTISSCSTWPGSAGSSGRSPQASGPSALASTMWTAPIRPMAVDNMTPRTIVTSQPTSARYLAGTSSLRSRFGYFGAQVQRRTPSILPLPNRRSRVSPPACSAMRAVLRSKPGGPSGRAPRLRDSRRVPERGAQPCLRGQPHHRMRGSGNSPWGGLAPISASRSGGAIVEGQSYGMITESQNLVTSEIGCVTDCNRAGCAGGIARTRHAPFVAPCAIR